MAIVINTYRYYFKDEEFKNQGRFVSRVKEVLIPEPNRSKIEPFSFSIKIHTKTNSMTWNMKIKVKKSVEVIKVLMWSLISQN